MAGRRRGSVIALAPGPVVSPPPPAPLPVPDEAEAALGVVENPNDARRKSAVVAARLPANLRRRSSIVGRTQMMNNVDQTRVQPLDNPMRMTPQMVHLQYEMKRNHTKEQELKRATAAAAAAAAAVSAAIKDVIGDTPEDMANEMMEDMDAKTLHDDDHMDGLEEYSPGAHSPSSRHGRYQRSNSPIIVWRPNLRVKIATDIPEELLRTTSLNYEGDQLDDRIALSALINYNGGSGSSRGDKQQDRDGADATGASPSGPDGENEDDHASSTVTGTSYRAFEYGKRLKKKRKSRKDGSGSSTGTDTDGMKGGGSGNKARSKSSKKKYGAWYIPPMLWADYMKTGDDALKLYNDNEQKPHHGNDYLTSKLVDLYSSKMYKEYILRAGYRLPHYLEAVQVEAVNSNEGGGGAGGAQLGGTGAGGGKDSGDTGVSLPSIL